MAGRTLGALVTAFCLLAGPASAQVLMGGGRAPGIRHQPPPPRPEPPAARPETRPDRRHDARPDRSDHRPAPGEDLFRARPDTYIPRQHRSRYERRGDVYRSYAAPEIVVMSTPVRDIEVVVVEGVVERVVEKKPEEREPAPRTESASPPAPPALVMAAAARKTLYVIPRCYAGDRLPNPGQLPAGCDVRNVRVFPVS